MYCADCGAANVEDSTYCNECGIRLAVSLDAGDTQVLGDQGADTARLGATPAPRSLRAIVERAHELADAQDLDGAIDMCRRAVIMEPRSRAAHALLGLLYEKKGHTKFAIREYRVVLEIDPDSTAEREKLEMLLEREKDETDSFVPVAPSTFWHRWRIAVIGGAAAMAFAVVAIIVHFARQPEPSTVQPVALRTTATEPGTGYYPATPGVGLPGRANPRGAHTPYRVLRSDLSPFARPNWAALGQQPGDARRVVPTDPRSSGETSVTPPRIVDSTPWPSPQEGSGGTGTGAEPRPREPAAPGMFEAVEEGTGGSPAPSAERGPSLLIIERVAPGRTPTTGMFTPVEPAGVSPPTTTGEDEKAGQAAQMRGLRLKAAGKHREAISEFRQAIDAYEREVEKRGASDKLLRAIETCKHGMEYSESRLKGR